MNGQEATDEFIRRLREATNGILASMEDARDVQFAAVIRVPGTGYMIAAYLNTYGPGDEKRQLINLFERGIVNLQQVRPIRSHSEPVE